MSMNFEDYNNIFSPFDNGQLQALQQQQQRKQEEEKQAQQQQQPLQFQNSLFSNYNQLDQLDLGNIENYQTEKLSSSTYDSLSPSFTPTDSSPEAILFGDNYKNYNQMDVDGILTTEDFNFDATNNDNNNNSRIAQQFGVAESSTNSSPDSFQSSPDAFQPVNNSQYTAVSTRDTSAVQSTDSIPTTKGKRGRKPSSLVKQEASDSSLPVLSKSISSGSGVTKPGKKIKASHNLIEKKYRTNINSKIIELRNCVPALRILISKNHNLHNGCANNTSSNGDNELGEFDDDYEGEGYTDDERKLDGLKPAKKLNKATILSKATEYIRHLEHKVESLTTEVDKLRDIVLNANGGNDILEGTGLSLQAQQHSPQSMSSSPPSQQANQRSSLTNNLLMGGLTCLVGASTLDDFDSSNNAGSFKRGLFSIPILSIGSNQSSTVALKPLFGLFKIFFIFGVLFYMVEPFFKQQPDKKKQKQSQGIEWVSILKAFQYLASPLLFIEEVVKIKSQEAFAPLLIPSADLQLSTLSRNFIRMVLSDGKDVNLVLSKSLYLRFISDYLQILSYPLLKLSESYWNKAKELSKDCNDSFLKSLLNNYKDVLRDDAIFASYVEILEQRREDLSIAKSPFEILSVLIVEKQMTNCLKQIIELETIEDGSSVEAKELREEVETSLDETIELSNSMSHSNSELLLIKSLIEPRAENVSKALSVFKEQNYETNVNSNALICGLIKLQILNDDLDKSKLLILFKKLKLQDVDLLSFTSLYQTINLFPRDILIDESLATDSDSNSMISDSSIEYREHHHSIEYKLSQHILSILASLRIYSGKADNLNLSTGLKAVLIERFVNEINDLDC